MILYENLPQFVEEQNAQIVSTIKFLNKILNDDIYLIIEASSDSIFEPAHFYFISDAMGEKNLDINLDNYFHLGVEHVPSHFRRCIEDNYESLHGKALLLTHTETKKLDEVIEFLVDADNKIGLAHFPEELEQYEFSKDGVRTVLKQNDNTLKKNRP